jgi:hypothetical protein
VSSEQQPQSSVAGGQGPSEPASQAQSERPVGQSQSDRPMSQAQPSEEELRAAYEAELNRITSAEMIIQTTVSLINIAGRRLGLAPAGAGDDPSAAPGSERDLEQVRDAIDGASALMPILERRMPGELAPLRDAIAQLQVAYAREAQSSSTQTSTTSTAGQGTSSEHAKPLERPVEKTPEGDGEQGPGPAQASGRLWVPGH